MQQFPFEPAHPQKYEICFRHFYKTCMKVGTEMVDLTITPGRPTRMPIKDFKASYAEEKCLSMVDGEWKLTKFIDRFLDDNRKKKYHLFGVYPPSVDQPRGVSAPLRIRPSNRTPTH